MTLKHFAPIWTQRIAEQRRSGAERLVAALATAKFIDVSVPGAVDLAEWRKTVDFAKRHGLVPLGHRLEKQMLSDNLLRIKLIGGVHPNTRTSGKLSPVPIPRKTVTTHPAVAVIRDSDDQLQIPGHLRRRALTVLEAVANELERRGLAVSARSPRAGRSSGDNYYGHMATRREGRIDVVIAGITSSIAVTQNSPLSTDTERAERMAIEIWPWPKQGPHIWVDGKRQLIEDRLADVLAALERAAAQSATQRDSLERDRQLRQVAWEAAFEKARRLAIEERHLRVLRQNIEAWKFGQELREYIEVLHERIDQLSEGDNRNNAEGWLEWANQFLERSDPLRSLPPLPDPAREPGIKEIEQHMGGLSPYGP